MRKFTYIFLSLLTVFITNSSFAQSNTKITKHIDQLIKSTDPNVNIGVYVVNLDNNKLIYSRNAKRSFTPASTQKLLTAAAALLYFGPSYEYQTKLLTNAKITRGKVLTGNLYLKLDVDPSLQKYDILNLFSQLRRKHISEIKGDSGILGYCVESKVVSRSGPFRIRVLLDSNLYVKQATVISYPWDRGRDVRKRAFTSQFKGKGPEDPIQLGKDIDAITGATISSRVMAEGVRDTIKLLKLVREKRREKQTVILSERK